MRWKILALLFLARVGLGLQFQTLASTGDYLRAEFSLGFVDIGSLIGLFMLPGLVLAMPAGFIGRYVSDRVLVSGGLGLLAAGGFLAAIGSGYDWLAAARIIAGIGFVITSIYFTKMTTDWFAGKELATALSVLVMSWPIGIAIGQVGHEWLAAAFGWPSAFIAAASFCLLAALAILGGYRPADNGVVPVAAQKTHFLTRHEIILTSLAGLAWGFFNAAYVVYLSFAPKILTAAGIGALQAAAVISIASWVMIFSGVLSGYIADRFGKPYAMIYAGLSIAILSLLLLQYVEIASFFALAFGLFGMAPAGLIIAFSGAAMAAERRASGMGFYFSIYFLVVTPAPAIAGWLLDRSGDAYDAIIFAALLFALTAAAAVCFQICRRRLATAADLL